MATQPEAPRLADELDQYLYSVPAHPLCTDAAAELRRQHGEIKSMRAERLRSERRLSAVEAQRNALLEALKDMLLRDEKNTCRHEETHRGGAIWEICDSCGAMWADDEGGKPEWEDPKEWTQARAAIKAVEEGK